MTYKVIPVFILLLTTIQALAQDNTQVKYRNPLYNFEVSKRVLTLNEEEQSRPDSNFRSRVVTGYREGVEPVKRQYDFNMDSQVSEKQGTISLATYNASIEELLTHGMVLPYFVILEVKDPSKYRYDKRYGSKLEWLRKNAYCYELTMKRSSFNGVQDIEQDVADYFGLQFLEEKRKVKVLTVSFSDRSAYYTSINTLKKETALNFSQLNSLLLNAGFPMLNTKIGGVHLIFDLGADPEIQSAQGLAALKQRLKQQGLNLTEELVEKTVYIIREQKQINGDER